MSFDCFRFSCVVDLRRLPSVLSGSAFVQALKNTRSKLQAVVDLEREKIGISGVLTQNYRILKPILATIKRKTDMYQKIQPFQNRRSAVEFARHLDKCGAQRRFRQIQDTLLLDQGSVLAQT